MTERTPTKNWSKARHFQFGTGSEICQGTATITLPFTNWWFSFYSNVSITDISFFLEFLDTNRLGKYFDILKELPVHLASEKIISTIRLFVYAFIQWNTHIKFYFTYLELCRLRSRWGSISADKLYKPLARAELDTADAETHQNLSEIERASKLHEVYDQRPCSIRFLSRKNRSFNDTVYI